MARRPGILAANACFLLSGAGLVMLGELSPLIISAVFAVFGNISQPSALLWADALYYLPCVLLPCILLGRKYGPSALALENVPPGHASMSVMAAVLCMPVVNGITIVWSVILESMGFVMQDAVVIMENTGDLVTVIFAMAVLPGICEELLFRGVIIGSYRAMGAKKALIISALMFASLHGSVQGLPGQILMGLVLGHVVLSGGSVYTGMMLHTAYNSILIMITYVQQRTPVENAAAAPVIDTLGISGIAAVFIETAITAGFLYVIMRYFTRHSVLKTAAGGDAAGINADDNTRDTGVSFENSTDMTGDTESFAGKSAGMSGHSPENEANSSDASEKAPEKTGAVYEAAEEPIKKTCAACEKAAAAVGNMSGNKNGYGVCETLVLISGIVTVAYLYLTDILYMLGYLQ